MVEPERRRRRLRPPTASGGRSVVPDQETANPAPPVTPLTASPPARQVDRPGPAAGRRPTSDAGAGAADDREMERGLRGLVGSGSSQVSVGAALRARDAARPGPEHLADAEANLVIVRRNWMPREELPRR